IIQIEGEKLTLNHIEHHILRPIYQDNRLHYALNCASLGCPDLQNRAFTSKNMEKLLNNGAERFINHTRGVEIIHQKLKLSSIYQWYAQDFGQNLEEIKKHLLKYAYEPLKNHISQTTKSATYQYDWSLNNY
ncbi:MAG: DUF547 domain-containing protein, partial [Spirochaetes bacterium]|nr:DUF547 domain-containing protein [Spirochaetota bacterium]